MALPLILGAAAAVPGILKGIFAKGSHNKYAKLLMGQKLEMPDSINDAEDIFSKNSQRGLIGKDNIDNDIERSFADSMRTATTIADSPNALMEALIQGQIGVSNQKTKLGVMDAEEKAKNELMLANFLSSVKAPAEQRIEEFDINKTLSAQREKMAGTNELFSGISSGIGAGISAYGMGEQLKAMKDRNTLLNKFWE